MEDNGDGTGAVAFGIGDNMIADPLEGKVDLDGSDHQTAKRQVIDTNRQPRAFDVDCAAFVVNGQAEASLEDHESRTRSPSLRKTSDRIGDRRLSSGPLEAAEEFGKPHAELDRGLEGFAHEAHDAVPDAVTRHPRRAQSRVVWPH
jgi:hypothetical protein